MKKNFLLIILLFVALMGTNTVFAQGNTTSAINGRVLDYKGESLPGATVVAIDIPSQSHYGAVTDKNGYYRIPNMNVGGPYEVTVSFVGYQSFKKSDVFLTLGQTFKLDVKLSEAALMLEDVVVSANQNDIFDGNRTGAETYVSKDNIDRLPTLSRSLTDYVRLTPQVNITPSTGEISAAGINNRYNSISFDGAVNNDVFGLAATGTNGGQTGGNPISLDAIDQIQIAVAPYDVRQGGFSGASINVVSRRGTNEFEGSAYFFYRNQDMAGKTPGEIAEGETREKLADFTSKTYGLRVGGPIIKDKLFFFINGEFQRDQTPQPFDFANYSGNSTQAELQAFSDKLSEYGYSAGGYLNNTKELNSDKFLARVDWNINDKHKLTLRHSYVKNESINAYASNRTSINFYNNGFYFPSITNSSALELKSNWNNKSNNLIIGYTRVSDDRNPMGEKFPYLRIFDGSGNIYAGSERYSTGNIVEQDVLTFNDNFSIYKGAHTITVGANVQYSKSYNLYIKNAFGYYTFNSIDDFMNGADASSYEHSYSLLDDVVGDGSKAGVDMKSINYGIYAQDEWQIRNNFKLTYGLRLNVPQYLNKPSAGEYQDVWDEFNDEVIPQIEATGYDLEGAKIGEMPRAYLSIDPRIGFNWDVFDNQRTQIRGGVGLFTSRIPLVLLGGVFLNNAVTVGGVYYTNGVPFNPEWNSQAEATDLGQTEAIPSGQIDLFSSKFKNPQVLRASLGIDQKLPWWGLIASAEAIYTKNINEVTYYNVNQEYTASGHVDNGPDQRPYYSNTRIDDRFTHIIFGTNTSEGYSYNLTAQLTKPETKGFFGTISYTFGRSIVLNDAISTQNVSQWRYMETINGLNNLDLSYSDFDLGSRVMTFLSYKIEYGKNFASTLSLVYNGQSGARYSYVYNDSNGKFNGEGQNAGNLIWIPANANEINLVDIVDNDGNITMTAADQWTHLNNFIESDKSLSENRGEYAKRNASRMPFENIIDLRFVHDFYMKFGSTRHKLQLTLDIFNFTNMLNPEWGMRRFINYDTYQLIKYVGTDDNGKAKFQYTGPDDVKDIYNLTDGSIYGSRWSMQVGIRYIFN